MMLYTWYYGTDVIQHFDPFQCTLPCLLTLLGVSIERLYSLYYIVPQVIGQVNKQHYKINSWPCVLTVLWQWQTSRNTAVNNKKTI